jgi:two-component system, NarL family, sensor histidine kinase BarA
MSYRAFKRLLGETSLERKCRFLFGACILLLITASFWLYAYRTEHLAYDQTIATCRVLVNQVFDKWHMPKVVKWQNDKLLEASDKNKKELQGAVQKNAKAWELMLEAHAELDSQITEKLGGYNYQVLRPDNLADRYERELFAEFTRSDDPKDELPPLRSNDQKLRYYGAIRAEKKCIECHGGLTDSKKLAENDVTVIHIRMPTKEIEDGVQRNRAVLLTTALVTVLLIMAGSYLIVRYVIVKPVKHLKEVSDAIAAGELNVRSEIQTGDEFEDLSHAFNRMLRNLVSMQDQWRKVNVDLDRKVDELAQANMALYESNRLKSDFLATMSHELRTPLNSILGFSEVLLSGNQLTDKQLRWVGNIQSSGEKLLNLINDILDLAKIEAGKMHVRLEDFSVHDVCEGVVNMFRPLAEKKNIDLRGQVDPGIPGMRQDVVKFQQILQNLLSNAIKFTPEGGRVLLKGDADPQFLIVTVQDTGVGIAPEEQDLVFEKFRQAGNPLTREHAGTGLGLSIVRELSKLLGGDVRLQSELGRGSTFILRLPLHLSEEPRLEFDLADERIDLSKAQRVDVRLYATAPPVTGTPTKVERIQETQVELPKPPT